MLRLREVLPGGCPEIRHSLYRKAFHPLQCPARTGTFSVTAGSLHTAKMRSLPVRLGFIVAFAPEMVRRWHFPIGDRNPYGRGFRIITPTAVLPGEPVSLRSQHRSHSRSAAARTARRRLREYKRPQQQDRDDRGKQ